MREPCPAWVLEEIEKAAEDETTEVWNAMIALKNRLAPPLRKLHRCEGVRVVVRDEDGEPCCAWRWDKPGPTPVYYVCDPKFPDHPWVIDYKRVTEITDPAELAKLDGAADWINSKGN